MIILNDWENLTKEQYKAKKEEVAKFLLTDWKNLFPEYQDEIEYYEVGTHLQLNRYTLNPGGAVYGFAQTPGKTGH